MKNDGNKKKKNKWKNKWKKIMRKIKIKKIALNF